jgi:hypothetical protein
MVEKLNIDNIGFKKWYIISDWLKKTFNDSFGWKREIHRELTKHPGKLFIRLK